MQWSFVFFSHITILWRGREREKKETTTIHNIQIFSLHFISSTMMNHARFFLQNDLYQTGWNPLFNWTFYGFLTQTHTETNPVRLWTKRSRLLISMSMKCKSIKIMCTWKLTHLCVLLRCIVLAYQISWIKYGHIKYRLDSFGLYYAVNQDHITTWDWWY